MILDGLGMNVQRKTFDFFNYMVIGRDTEQTSVIQFVRSLQALSPDSATRDASVDVIGGGSIDHMAGMGGIEPVTLEEMLLTVPEGRQVSDLIKKLGDHLQKTGEISTLDAAFKSAKKMQVKMDVGAPREVTCALKSELQAYLESQKVPDEKGGKMTSQLFETAEI